MRGREAGFSLVELLVSLVLFSLLSLLLLSGIGTGRRVWEKLEDRTAGAENVEIAQMVLRARLERAYPLTRTDATVPYVDFEGEGQAVRFLATPPLAGRPAALRRHQLGLTAAGELILVSVSELSFTPQAASSSETLLEGVESVDFAYWGVAPMVGGRRWSADWRARPELPELVRIRVTFEPGDRRRWPELIVQPAARVPTGCLMDAETGLCGGSA